MRKLVLKICAVGVLFLVGGFLLDDARFLFPALCAFGAAYAFRKIGNDE